MNLFTTVNITAASFLINPTDQILSLGSCFSEHIGKKLNTHKIATTVNPFGTLFNPVSIAKLLGRSIDLELFEASEVSTLDERNFHYDLHSSFNHVDKNTLIHNANKALKVTNDQLKKSNLIMITLGSSIAYTLHDGTVVANCHKVPAKQFVRKMLSVDEMKSALQNVIRKIEVENPDVKYILTVSPVRHLKEGHIDNAVSKGRLLDLCHQMASSDDDIYYFPSYEIMMDELRDYRFYKEDMLHPNEIAIDIIWNRFVEHLVSKKGKEKIKTVASIVRSASHRPFDPDSKAHQKFIEDCLQKLNHLSSTYPESNFEDIKSKFDSQLLK